MKQNSKTVQKKSHRRQTFSQWYESLPANQQAAMRNEICVTCAFSTTKFYRIVREEAVPKILEAKAINSIAGLELQFPLAKNRRGENNNRSLKSA